MSTRAIVDLFAGPGGWDEGLKQLGRDADCLGIEWDEAACATARAAGHRRTQADIAALNPADFGPVWGLIASPPCQAYSTAGKGKGRADKEHVIACAHELATGNDTRVEHLEQCEDPRSLLTVEPLRWALALRPRWIACEQVPAVLGLWTLFAELLSVHGYHTAAGYLSAEQHGVPQTRKRAFLIASLDGPVDLPAPTHQKYKKAEPAQHRDGLLPWVSMAEALGWGMTERPSVTVVAGSNRQGPPAPLDGGAGPRKTLRDAYNTGAWVGPPPFKNMGEPVSLRGDHSVAGVGRAEREAQEPALTVGTAADRWKWVLHTNRDQKPDGSRQVVECGRPAPTLTAKSGGQWIFERPATTVNCDPRISQPGRHDPAVSGSQQRDAIRVTATQASVLQGFRPDYPWQGTKTKQFQQIGNAVCPPLAARVLEAAMAPSTEGDA